MRKLALFIIILLLSAGALLIIKHGTTWQCVIFGATLILVGLPLLILSRIQLGKAFSVGPRATSLVTNGLFSRIPHPMYVFLDLTLLGAILIARLQCLLAVWLGVVAVQAWQSARESKVLEQAFGDAYRTYRTHTWW